MHVAYLCRECSNFRDIYCDRCNMVKKIEIGREVRKLDMRADGGQVVEYLSLIHI